MVLGEERGRITSDNYIDLIIDIRTSPDVFLSQFTDPIIQPMNDFFAIVYVPVGEVNFEELGGVTFAAIPNMYGLTSAESLESSGVFAIRETPVFNLQGEGVLVGIIDTGIDYTNQVFQHEDGSTKIVSIWDQEIDSADDYPYDYYFGTEYTRGQINEALSSDDPLSIVPSMDEHGHGTMLGAVAAGRDIEEEGFYGVAPASELVVVKLRQAKQIWKDFYLVPEDTIAYQGNHIMWGIQYCAQVAVDLNRPIVICIGVGTSQDAHDGGSSFDTWTSIIADFPEFAVVTAAGNEGTAGRHFHGVIQPNFDDVLVEMIVGEEEGGFVMELWGSSPGIFSIDILSPNGEYIPRIPASLVVNRVVSFIFEETIIYINYHTVESDTGDQLILMRFQDPTPGLWRFNVYGRADMPVDFHIWLPMGNFITDETFFVQSDIYTTVLGPGNARNPITVTAYNPTNNNLFVNASRGYSRIGEIKPELAAPGVNYLAPTLNHGWGRYTGTSVAAAHTAGIAALMLEWGIVDGNYPSMNSVVIKKYLIRGARRASSLGFPNRDWGYGIIDVFNVFDILRLNI